MSKTRRMTLTELDKHIQSLKASQYKWDRECSFGREEEICTQCRYVAGYWGDTIYEVTLVEEWNSPSTYDDP